MGTEKIALVRWLADHKFYVVDVNVTLEIDQPTTARKQKINAEIVISEIQKEQHDRVLQIAANCFRYSRFHLDPNISNAIANRIKHNWVLSTLQGQRGDKLFVALIKGQPVGFLAALASSQNGKNIRSIDLIGVDESFQGRGVGKALVNYFIHHYQSQCDFLRVGTQIANIPSVRFYQSLGFSMVATDYVLHRHIPDINPHAD